MINELTEAIYQTTEAMNRALLAGNEEEFDRLLNDRNRLMVKVDTLKAEDPEFQYSQQAKQQLANALRLDQYMADQMKQNVAETQQLLQQTKVNKQVSNMYRPYYKQTNGAFIDSKN